MELYLTNTYPAYNDFSINVNQAYKELNDVLRPIYNDLKDHSEEHKIELIDQNLVDSIINSMVKKLTTHFNILLNSNKFGYRKDIVEAYNNLNRDFDTDNQFLENNYDLYVSNKLPMNDEEYYKKILKHYQNFNLTWYIENVGLSTITKEFMVLILK